MKIKRVINIEDNVLKHMAIVRALEKSRVTDVEWARNGEEGIAKMEQAIREKKDFDLLITDMHYCFQGKDDVRAGAKVMKELKRRGIDIPVVVCSSHPYKEPDAVDNIFYNERSRDLDWDIQEMLKKFQ